MSNLHNLQRVVIEMTSYSHHMTQTKHKNRQAMETNDTCFCEESFIDRLFLVWEILRGGAHKVAKPKKPMVNRVSILNLIPWIYLLILK